MSSPAYLPNVQNNSTSQIRRRANNTVSAVVQNQAATSQVAAQLPAKAPVSSPSFSGPVTQSSLPVLTNADIHTVATAGGASALPSNPAGYTMIQINGQNYKIALYRV